MSDKKETISDIVKDMRKPKEGENGYLRCYLAEYADRIEEAWTEEKDDIDREAYWRGADVVLDVVKKLDCVPRDEVQGNAAAMREALRKIYDLIVTLNCDSAQKRIVDKCRIIAEAALAEPVRNCDIPDREKRFDKYCENRKCQGMDCEGVGACYAEWLLETAKEGDKA